MKNCNNVVFSLSGTAERAQSSFNQVTENSEKTPFS
jgi:hypothetical protein